MLGLPTEDPVGVALVGKHDRNDDRDPNSNEREGLRVGGTVPDRDVTGNHIWPHVRVGQPVEMAANDRESLVPADRQIAVGRCIIGHRMGEAPDHLEFIVAPAR